MTALSIATRLGFRLLAAFIAFCIGWLVYMIAMVLTVYDGFPSLLLQPLMAALWSFVFVLFSLALGLPLKIPILSRYWTRTPLIAALLSLASLFLLVFGFSLGLTTTGVDPDTGTAVEILHPAVAIGGYLGLLFPIANWPIPRILRLPTGRRSKPRNAQLQ